VKREDARIDAWARAAGERHAIESDELWRRIERSLDAPPRAPLFLVPAAAAAVAALVLATFELRPPRDPGPLLAASEAAALERELLHAEARVRELSSRMTEPAEPFASQLDYLESNLDHCRALAAANPNNREVRRSLVRAVRGKAHVLEELLSTDTRRTDR
jgi:hypothetical protein